MYKTEVPTIRGYVEAEGKAGFQRTFHFVLATIRCKFHGMGKVVDGIERDGLNSKYVWGNKVGAYSDFQMMQDELYEKLVEEDADIKKGVLLLRQLHGIGTAKASFFMQLLGYDTGCLDVHNLNLLGIKQEYFKPEKKVDEYLKLVKDKGGAEFWWDHWCETLAAISPASHFEKDPQKVSSLHTEIIVR